MARAGLSSGRRALWRSPRFRGLAVAFASGTLIAAATLTACNPYQPAPPGPTPRPAPSPVAMRLAPAPGVPGDPNAGMRAFTDSSIFPPNGCGTCHTVPGVASGVFPYAPNLNNVVHRPTLSGDSIPSSPDNLKRWIMDPPSMKSDAKMPKVNVTDRQAEDIAAFLYAQSNTPAR